MITWQSVDQSRPKQRNERELTADVDGQIDTGTRSPVENESKQARPAPLSPFRWRIYLEESVPVRIVSEKREMKVRAGSRIL